MADKTESGITRREFVERGAAVAAAGLVGVRSMAMARVTSNDLTLENDLITATWTAADGILRPNELSDRLGNTRLTLPEQLFTITLADGMRLESSTMRVAGTPSTEALVGAPKASRFAERVGGHRLTVTLEDASAQPGAPSCAMAPGMSGRR
jgi:hypothetical protein